MVDRFRNTAVKMAEMTSKEVGDEEEQRDPMEELACDGVILDMVYCKKRSKIRNSFLLRKTTRICIVLEKQCIAKSPDS